MLDRRPSVSLSENFKEVEEFVDGFTYVIYSTLLPNIVMITIGFTHKDSCPMDDRVPRFLIFGGLSGLMVVILRTILLLTLKLNKNFDILKHPGLNMVRAVMYLFISFTLVWSFHASSILISSNPDLEDPFSSHYCHKTPYYYSYVWFLFVDLVCAIVMFLWLLALVSAFINPDFLILAGIIPPSLVMKNIIEMELQAEEDRKKGFTKRWTKYGRLGDRRWSTVSVAAPIITEKMSPRRRSRSFNVGVQLAYENEIDKNMPQDSSTENDEIPPPQKIFTLVPANDSDEMQSSS